MFSSKSRIHASYELSGTVVYKPPCFKHILLHRHVSTLAVVVSIACYQVSIANFTVEVVAIPSSLT